MGLFDADTSATDVAAPPPTRCGRGRTLTCNLANALRTLTSPQARWSMKPLRDRLVKIA